MANVAEPSSNSLTSQQQAQARLMNQLNWRPQHSAVAYTSSHYGHPPAIGHAGGSKIFQTGSSSSSSAHHGASNAAAAPLDDFQETKSITLEWKLSNLKAIFDTSRGDVKSRCIKSPVFGDGKWEIYFYGNSGADHVSLYLSAEPTLEERERGLKFAARNRSHIALLLARSASNASLAAAAATTSPGKAPQPAQQQHHNLLHTGQASTVGQQAQQQQHSPTAQGVSNTAPWIREGSYRFAFEIRSTNKKEAPIKMMEAADHVFSSEARNWGWQSFARRADVYYNNMAVRHADAFVIACTITHTPSRPSPLPSPNVQKRLMPLELINAFAGMFDQPVYSDIKFVIRRRSATSGKRKEKTLYAIRRILASRSEYFDTMFSSGFSEDNQEGSASGAPQSRKSSIRQKDGEESEQSSEDSDDLMNTYDSASEGEGEDMLDDMPAAEREEDEQPTRDEKADFMTDDENEEDEDGSDDENHTAHTSILEGSQSGSAVTAQPFTPASASGSAHKDDTTNAMNLDPTPLHSQILPNSPSRRYPTRLLAKSIFPVDLAAEKSGTSTMRSVSTNMHSPMTATSPRSRRYLKRNESRKVPESGHTEAGQPLRESQNSKDCVTVIVKDASYTTYKALLYFLYTDTITFAPLSSIYSHARDTAEALGRPSRKQFFDAYVSAVYGPSSPYHARPKDLICSSKAMYKLADKLNMTELKCRAFEHIVQSLSIESIPYEVFSAFSEQFPEVRKVQMDMMLHYWNDVREGQAMKNVLRLIRAEPDRFPGYEEVWQHLLLNLEYRATGHPTSPLKEGA